MDDRMAEDAGCAGVVSCRAEIDKLSSQIHAHVFYSCSIHLECSRCLSPFSQVVGGEFRVLFQQGSMDNSPRPLHNEGTVDGYYSDEYDEIDLTQTLFDEIMTSIPMRPLCSEGCGGINREAALSEERKNGPQIDRALDPRWEALKKMKNHTGR